MPLGAQVAATDGAAQVEHRPRGETKGSSKLGRPDRGLKGQRRVVAGERRNVMLALRRVHGPNFENKFAFHDLESPAP